MTTEEKIGQNLLNVSARIKKAAERSGRSVDDILLIAVSKTVSAEVMKIVLQKNIKHFGENRVQELLEKYDILKEGCNWHFIGRLQTNKVKYIVDKVSMVHSVDRFGLAEEVQKRAEACNRVIDVLVQANISGENTKAGLPPEEIIPFLKRVACFPNIRVKGLMTIAPYAENPEEIRWVFRALKNISVDIDRENIDNIVMQYLSMGMSQDFEVAVEEGANIVRVGSSIFGRRNYPEVCG